MTEYKKSDESRKKFKIIWENMKLYFPFSFILGDLKERSEITPRK